MPRIDPISLLKCLDVLLSPVGGIKSSHEVHRLVSLMTKFSKKLVSKCIYVLILKHTETDLLNLFMGSGGWQLVHMWLTENIVAKNWSLVQEILELLLVCPVDIERLKTNNCPKLVKELSKDGNHFAIRALASKVVVQWLKIVKGEKVIPIQLADLSNIVSVANNELNCDVAIKPEITENKTAENHVNDTELNNSVDLPSGQTEDNDTVTEKDAADTKPEEDSDKLPVLKISLKDGKQVLSQVDNSENKSSEGSDTDTKEHHRSKSKDKTKDRSSNSNSKSSSSSKHSSKRDSSSSDKHKSRNKSSSSSRHSSKEGSKEKDKHSSSSSKSRADSKSSKSNDKLNSSSSKSSSKEERRSSSDKDRGKGKDEKSKDNLQKSTTDKTLDDKISTPPSIHKLGKIPKLSDLKKDKPSISIEVRKPDEPKPKTVKTFHSKFRKHGLEEEIKPPPSRAALLNKKPPPIAPPSIPIPKRPSPVHSETPPEKKIKIIEPVEKPGAIKLIPPKPKPMVLLESDMFMDALTASATNKKEPKKRKRRTSGSKDGNAPNEGSPPHTPTIPNSPSSESKSVPPRFYQDTLDTDESKEKSEKSSDSVENMEAEIDKPEEPENLDHIPIPHTVTVNGLKGVLCYHKKKGPKKSIKWKPESELEEIQYFELDETERVNVTKTFTDMKHLERIHEREAFQKGRNIGSEDVMEEKTSWKPLMPLEIKGQVEVDYGKNSKEKDIQAIRQKGTLQPLYFHKSMIPDSALEPEPETHPYSEPANIPLEDVTGNQDNVSDFRNMPWPEPKGNAPPVTVLSMPPMFPNNMMQVPNGFPNAQFPGVPVVPGFQGPMVPSGDWQNGMPPHMINNMAPGVIPPGVIPPGPMPPGMMMPNQNMAMGGPEMFGGPNPMFPIPPEGFNMPQNMYPMDFNMAGPQGPPGPDNFPGPGNFRGAMRGRGVGGGHWRGKAVGNWDNNQRGRGGGARGARKTTVCMYFQRKGSCRQGDNCSFLHPGVNGPY